MKESEEELYNEAQEDLMPPAPDLKPLGGSVAFARGGVVRKSKSILKKEGVTEEKKKRVRMLFPEDTMTPL